MLVSIVTVYYNRENFVTESIRSLLSQTYKNVEIIAIDDGSTDGTYKKLKSVKDDRIKVITQENCGFVQSLKKAISMASGQIIAIHGSGDISHPTRIYRQVKVLMENKDIGVVGSYIKNINKITGQEQIKSFKLPGLDQFTKVIKNENPFTHGNIMYRRSIYEKSGGYREFFKYTQDRDLWLRMSLLTKFYMIPEVLYTRYILADGVSNNPEKILMQRYFGEISKQCIDLRIKGEPDLIDRYGIYAPLFMRRSKRLSRTLRKISISYYLKDRLDVSDMFINHSLKEDRNIINVFMKSLISLSHYHKVVNKILIKILNSLKGPIQKVRRS